MAAEFKIGRLRFTWAGAWAAATFYNRDAVTQYNGKTYVCIEPHTSDTDFYADLRFITPAGGNEPRWDLLLDGRIWRDQWLPLTDYSLGNIVTYGGVVYVCIAEHTSAAEEITLANWATYSRFDNWNSAWTTDTVYGLGDIVKYGGVVYRCTANHVSASTDVLGLEDDQSKWAVVNLGIDYKSNWTTNTRYKLNDVVKNGSDLYIATEGHSSGSSFNASAWDIWQPGTEYKSTWSSSAIYQLNDIVMYGGYSFRSIISNNTNSIPSITSPNWEIVTTGFKMQNAWSGGSYKVGDVVTQGGNLYVAIADSNGENPTAFGVQTSYVDEGSVGTSINVESTAGIVPGMYVVGRGFASGQTVVSVTSPTSVIINEGPDIALLDGGMLSFVGVNYVYWKLVVPGISWTGFWQTQTAYSVGELVVWANDTYMCIQSITNATTSVRPDLDINNTNWIRYAAHSRSNAGNTLGDIVTNFNNTTISIPIGTLGEALSVSNSQPSWRDINIIPAVYYVTPDGVDSPDAGMSWDNPWKSIKYACERVASGTSYPNAYTAIINNKEFLVEEMYQWMLYQKSISAAPFSPSSVFNATSTKRDAKYIIDAVSYDLVRNSNSRTVFSAEAYFEQGSATTFRNSATDAAQPYIVASLTFLKGILNSAINNLQLPTSYQVINGVPVLDRISQTIGTSGETGAAIIVDDLLDIVITAITNANTRTIPQPNQGLTATINVKTGTYKEELPIILPDNTALNGDELRGAVVMPKVAIYTFATASNDSGNTFTIENTSEMAVDMPIQFSVSSNNDYFSGINLNQTYYITSIVNNNITVSTTVGGAAATLIDGTGFLTVYAGDCLKDMFYVRNATGIRNMTLTGLAGSLTDVNQFSTRRPTGGAYVSLDPGHGPDDTSVWIIRRSPYIQNVTTFGVGCVGLKIDGYLHNGGNKSVTSNDFTQILSDGIGVWCRGPGSLTEAVSVFSYYNYASYFAEDGGRIRATNGNSSYGQYGVIAEGFDPTEAPISGKVDNRSTQVQANVQSAFGVSAQLLSMQYSNAGSGYNTQTTNLIKYSNQFDNVVWQTDGNILTQKNTASPVGDTNAWTITGQTSSTDSSYLYQTIAIPQAGGIYENLAGLNITGNGGSATFDVTVTSTEFLVSVAAGGSGYVVGNRLRILGGQLGGINGVDDCFLVVATLSGSSILTVTVSGNVPEGSAKPFTLSVYAKKGSAQSFDIVATFSGYDTVVSRLNYDFTNTTFTASNDGTDGLISEDYGRLELDNGWNRIWLTVYDTTGLNTALTYTIYPRGNAGFAGFTRIYGCQLQNSSDPSFYLETKDGEYTSHANFNITGAGSGVEVVADEVRSGAVFNTRLTDIGLGTGGRGYSIASNNAQGGDDTLIILAGSDEGTATNYTGMRAFIRSGTGAGQYGYISNYNSTSKFAQVLKESFGSIVINSTSETTDSFTVGDPSMVANLYIDQPVQFIPTYYSTNVTRVSANTVTVLATTGGSTNTVSVSSTLKLAVNMPVKFVGTAAGQLSTEFTYYIKEILGVQTITLSTSPFGPQWPLSPVTNISALTMIHPEYTSYITAPTANMIDLMPISFTGTAISSIIVGQIYYVSEVIDSNTFTIASNISEFTITGTAATTNYLTTTGATSLVPLNTIYFSGNVFGGVSAATKYYISNIINSSTFTIAESLIEVNVSATEVTTNLITVESTVGFTPDFPIIFRGNQFGGLTTETVFYILAINDGTSFTVAASPGGSAVNLTSEIGSMQAFTADSSPTLASSSGSMTGTTTNVKTTLTHGIGSMNGTFSTSLFGNVVSGDTYYIKTIDTDSFTVSSTVGGSTFALKTDLGSMNMGEVGWDHINPGTPIEAALTNSSVYFIEPRLTFSSPEYSQVTSSLTTLSGVVWESIEYGNGVAIALPSGGQIANRSTNGTTWTPITLPVVSTWTDIAYGKNYWVAISNEEPIIDNSPVIYSVSNGSGWRTTTMPFKASWKKIVYGNGKFVAIANDANKTFYGVPATNITGSGTNGLFSVAVKGTTYTISVVASGSGYAEGNQLKILGTALGGTSPANDVTITVGVLTVPALGGSPFMSAITWSGTAFDSTASSYSSYGTSWSAGNPLASARYTGLTYGNGKFVAVASGNLYTRITATNVTATGSGARFNVETSGTTYLVTVPLGGFGGTGYSVGQTLKILGTALGGTSPANDVTLTVTAVVVGLGGPTTEIDTVSAVGTAISRTSSYSTDGISWTVSTLPKSSAWSGVAYGNGLFVAVSSSGDTTAYSTDGINWLSSAIAIDGVDNICYGQGVYLASARTGDISYTSEDGRMWTPRAISSGIGYNDVAFGFIGTNYDGRFITVSGTNRSSSVSAGCKTKGRVGVTSGRITSITIWEPGSGYASPPTVNLFDPNITLAATAEPRISNGTLANPTFINRGTGYNTNSTIISILGDGYADTFQTGLTLIVKDLSRLPGPGDNLTIAGSNVIYKVTSASVVFGTVAPNIKANIRVSPDVTVATSPAHEAAIEIRTKYSQARLTGHDFLNVGYGNKTDSNYPGIPTNTVLAPQDQAVEVNFGRVFYVSTDQDGNFKVGDLFGVEQATGIVTISASQFGLSGLETLSLGGIAVGNASVIVRQFSTDQTMLANSNELISTQRAIKAYLTGRLSQGGSNTFTGQLIAGTVLIGGPNKISSTIPEGLAGSKVVMPTKVTVDGQFAGWDGDGMAMAMFMKSFVKKR